MADCNNNSDCGRLNYCDLEEEICVHEDIFPVKSLDIVGYCIMVVLLGIANIGGIVKKIKFRIKNNKK